ncbi:hypothetical protein CW746_11375 [Staphylococcus succinus]|uniref:DUF4097 family beta strand repeat-containing protein n=1 Tax=Staphylococcus succinus TaxID=61015 RepID=UPI000C33594A|nr:DUF4097 family beta strand repeat-containing protein [Staphylococcus succinus]PKI20701.1 hypothetical protein CW746_11375 [Staphylococcus succinus]
MKKLFIGGLVLFITCFLLGCLTWFSFEKQNNQLNYVNKTFDNDNISNLKIDSQNSVIEVKKGDKFSVHYTGKKNVDVTNEKKSLIIQQNSNTKDHYGLNFNPFRRANSKMIVTVPEKKINELVLSSQINSISVDDVDMKSAKFLMTDSGGASVKIDNSNIDQFYYRGVNSPVHLTNDKIQNANIKIKNEDITVNDSLIEKSVLLANKGDINLSKMNIESDFKASTQDGDIQMTYNKAPQNTLLKLNPEKGKAVINNKHFEDDKVGNGDNDLEFYTSHGDIHID